MTARHVPQRRRASRHRIVAAVLAALAVVSSALAAPAGGVQVESRTFEIARQLRCPVCVSESVGDSSSAIAIEMRAQIQEMLEEGRSEREILAFFRERYGDWILLEPPRSGVHLLVWLLPAVGVVAGVAGLAVLVTRWTRSAREPIHADEADLARVRAALGSAGSGDGPPPRDPEDER